jgi:hypothetical protein
MEVLLSMRRDLKRNPRVKASISRGVIKYQYQAKVYPNVHDLHALRSLFRFPSVVNVLNISSAVTILTNSPVVTVFYINPL